ncbi:hypothetical protein LOZ64_000643 [Ophidiomyces ophidiicola]|nr:hypothetical protein LOZ64_000643 [Ophidiomyces ophidiicola]KAI2015821.1 hypothetical protein LOZ49_000406 [Ophidiomyces ophidiicola]KAI2026406.1 hypothetical protein LOZ46_000398 [Ophidiomyces ophidiicola]KAI2145261.1 hypothetical protein LOZ29_000424 [Ophidiomyces ophidiicola]KAI2147609.1 hypothetical protein LOZ28_000124 [Ophidiomyces ophidiicola]
MSTTTQNFPSSNIHTIKTHNGPVNAVSFSSSPGTYILTGSSDRDVHLSRAIPQSSSASGSVTTRPIQKYEAHGYSVLDLTVTGDNARFASVGGDKQVFLWDVESGSTVRRWVGHDAKVEAVDFGGEADSVVISGSADTTVKIWDTRSLTSKPMQTLTEAGDNVSSLHTHMPTYTIMSGSYDGRIRTYDLRMGVVKVDVMGYPITSIRCSADGNAVLASCLDGRIRMMDIADGSVLKSFGEGNMDSDKKPTYKNKELRIRSTFARGDSAVISGSEPGDQDTKAYIFAWDVLSGNSIGTIPAGNEKKVVSCVAWNEKGKNWAAGCSNGSVLIFG